MQRIETTITFVSREDLFASVWGFPIDQINTHHLKNPTILKEADVLILDIDGAQRLLKCRHTEEFFGSVPRLSVPGNRCVQCGATIGQSVTCPGCGWVDPMTTSNYTKD